MECPLYHCCSEVTEPTTVPTTTSTTVFTTTTTQCSFCLDEEMKQRTVNGEPWTHAKDCCLTRSCKTDGHKCYIEDEGKSCPESLKCKKGEFLTSTADKYCLNDNCCPTEECLPCKCCDEKELDCPKIEEIKCNKCQVQKTVSLIEGTECCCPAEMVCVDRLCPAIKVASCRPCEMVVETVDECGCQSTICKPRPTPTCPECSKLICSGTDKETSCPLFECEAQSLDCPEGKQVKIIETEFFNNDKNCPLKQCCDPITTTTVVTTVPTTVQTTVQTTTCDCQCAHESKFYAPGQEIPSENACVTHICEMAKDSCTCSVKSTVVEPTPATDCKKGQYLQTTNLANKCQPVHQCLPCQYCNEEEQVLNCPVVEEPNCSECECKQVDCLVEGTECCCPAAYTCVQQPCDPPKSPNCGPCHKVVETQNTCGCSVLTCEQLNVQPSCDHLGDCFELVSTDKEDTFGCPIYKCAEPKCEYLDFPIVQVSGNETCEFECCAKEVYTTVATTTLKTTTTTITSTTGTTTISTSTPSPTPTTGTTTQAPTTTTGTSTTGWFS